MCLRADNRWCLIIITLATEEADTSAAGDGGFATTEPNGSIVTPLPTDPTHSLSLNSKHTLHRSNFNRFFRFLSFLSLSPSNKLLH